MKNNNKPIAILGGMGPQASTKLLEVLVSMAANDYGAKDDDDFPEIIVNSVPVPDFISNKANIPSVLAILKERVKTLERFNPASFSIACNTAHILLDQLQATTNIPFISMIDEVIAKVSQAQIKMVGLLGSPVTINSGLYINALEKKGIQTIVSSKGDQKVVENIIRNVLAGRIDTNDRKKLVEIAQLLKQEGAQGIILGCTELPLIFPSDFVLPVFDSIAILARALLKDYFKKL